MTLKNSSKLFNSLVVRPKQIDKPKIVFMGTPDFARVILEKLFTQDFKIVAVVAQPDKPKGRGQSMQSPPVALFAKEKKLHLLQPQRVKDELFLDEIRALDPDFVVVAAYGKLLPQTLLDIPKIDCLNVHASLLPEYRGAAPINQCLLDDKNVTGVSIMSVQLKLDSGPVYKKSEIPILDEDDAVSLTSKLSELGATALVEALPLIQSGELRAIVQDEGLATHVGKLSREMGKINWQSTAREIFNKTRALLPWPVAETSIEGKSLKIYRTKVLAQKSHREPGTIVHIGQEGFTVATVTTDLLVQEVQLEGKRRMNAFDLANGLRLKLPLQLG